MSERYTHRIEIYTSSLIVAGSYDLPIYRRVSDAINGEQRQYLPLRDATIAPMERPQQIQRVPHLLLDRAKALLIATIQEAAPPADYPREEQLRGVAPLSAMLFTATFVVRATFHTRPDLTLYETIERFTDDFVPLRNVHVFPLVSAFPPLTRDFAALSCAQIVAVYQVDAPAAAAPAEPLAPPVAESSATTHAGAG